MSTREDMNEWPFYQEKSVHPAEAQRGSLETGRKWVSPPTHGGRTHAFGQASWIRFNFV